MWGIFVRIRICIFEYITPILRLARSFNICVSLIDRLLDTRHAGFALALDTYEREGYEHAEG